MRAIDVPSPHGTPRKREPYKHGLLGRLLAFYRANPGEELSFQDIAIKFDVCERVVQARVCDAVKAGLLERVHVVRLKDPA
jgi:transcriptional regulator GlxA family with amidase domain